jgi:hypothetical protein
MRGLLLALYDWLILSHVVNLEVVWSAEAGEAPGGTPSTLQPNIPFDTL